MNKQNTAILRFSLLLSKMKPKWEEALFYMVVASCLSVANTYIIIFNTVFVEMGY